MKLYFRLSDRTLLVDTPQTEINKKPENYVPVVGVVDEYDPATHRLGSWTTPDIDEGDEILEKKEVVGHKPGVLTSFRKAIPRSEEEIASIGLEAWEDVRIKRDAFLADTNAQLLQVLEDALPANTARGLRDYRATLRDITDPAKNGGITDPSEIRLRRFNNA